MSDIGYFEHMLCHLRKSLKWWRGQKPFEQTGKGYTRGMIDNAVSYIESEIKHVENAIAALKEKELRQ